MKTLVMLSRAVDFAHDVLIAVGAAVMLAAFTVYVACSVLLVAAMLSAPVWIVGLVIWLVVRS